MPSLGGMASVTGEFMKGHPYKFYENTFYHVYNRGNNRENIFYKHENYGYFLRKYIHYLSEVLDTYAFCLLPNHFHLYVGVRCPSQTDKSDQPGINKLISEKFRRLFITYSQAVNKQENRTGSLFQKPFQRVPVVSKGHFSSLMTYIHLNPQIHGIIDDFRKYPYSSYSSLISKKPTFLNRKEVLSWYDSMEDFVRFHDDMKSIHLDSKLRIEM
jgi:putative transposase